MNFSCVFSSDPTQPSIILIRLAVGANVTFEEAYLGLH